MQLAFAVRLRMTAALVVGNGPVPSAYLYTNTPSNCLRLADGLRAHRRELEHHVWQSTTKESLGRPASGVD